jgi:hypothetical protein
MIDDRSINPLLQQLAEDDTHILMSLLVTSRSIVEVNRTLQVSYSGLDEKLGFRYEPPEFVFQPSSRKH